MEKCIFLITIFLIGENALRTWLDYFERMCVCVRAQGGTGVISCVYVGQVDECVSMCVGESMFVWGRGGANVWVDEGGGGGDPEGIKLMVRGYTLHVQDLDLRFEFKSFKFWEKIKLKHIFVQGLLAVLY